MAKKLVPAEFKTHLINQIIESVTERANTAYYAFVGDHETVASTLEEINQPTETVRQLNSEVFRNMIFGKKMSADDIRFVVNRNNWVSGTKYEMYDDQLVELQDKNFYVLVDEGSFKHVYKCLYNNNGAASTSKPLFANAKYDGDLYVAGDDYYETADGYQWKYMYSITSTVFNKFATEKYIPVVANTVVQDNAIEGSIDVIRVTFAGKQYDNYITGAKFEVADINRVTSTIIDGAAAGSAEAHFTSSKANQIYRIKIGAEQTTDFYKNTVLYITSGVGSGQYRTVEKSAYISDLGGVFVQLDEQFTTLPNETSTYEIMPKVQIIGDGNQTANAEARAIIDPAASNSVNKVEMLNVGKNYSFATASVLTGNPVSNNGITVSPTAATIRPIIPPQGGHGANTVIEFGARRLSFYMKYNRDEAGLIEPTNSFAQFGIIRDPQFANVAIYTTEASGDFVDDETVYQFSKIQIGSTGTFTSNTQLAASIKDTVDDRGYDLHFNTGDWIFLKTETTTPQYLLTKVAAGSSSNTINLAVTPDWVTATDTDVTAYYVHMQSDGIISNKQAPVPGNTSITTGILVNNCRPFFTKGSFIYGGTSKQVATIAGIDINSRIGQADADFRFADYNQMLKIIGDSVIDGPFTEDETVTQGTSSAQLHSSVMSQSSSTTLSLTNIQGNFNTFTNLQGSVSGAQLVGSSSNALDIRYGDLDPNRGAILYIQNDIPVDRDENQSEEIRVILEF